MPATTLKSAAAPGATSPAAPLVPPSLVPPLLFSLFFPLSPLLVASTEGSIVTVFFVFVITVVGYVEYASLAIAACASCEKYTIAAPGAGTFTVQLFAVWSHCTVCTFSSPCQRPSDAKRPPSVCQVDGFIVSVPSVAAGDADGG